MKDCRKEGDKEKIAENTTTINNRVEKDDENNTVLKTTIISKLNDGNTTNMNKPREENFLHKTTNVTDWMKKNIEKFVISKGFSIVFFDINTEIMTRLGNITVINTFEIKIKDDEGNINSLVYNSMNKEYEDMNMKWLIDFVKEKEMESILSFNTKNVEEGITEGSIIENKMVMKKEFESLKMTVFFSSKVDEMKRFLSEPQFVQLWTGEEMKDGIYEFENAMIKNIKTKNIKKDKECVEMQYKWKDWREFSEVEIVLEQVGDTVKLILNQKNIPVGLKVNVKNHWETRIFSMIFRVFGCAIKPL